MKLIKNHHGTSLVTVLMATGIGAIILAGITTMITDVFKSQRTAQSKDAHRELTVSIRQLLTDPVICSASFKGEDPAGTGFTRTQIVDAATPPNIKYQTGVNYLNNLVTITGFEVRGFVADNPTVNDKIGKAELNIKMNKLGSTIGSPQMTTTVFLQATLNAADTNLNSCYALGLADSLWQISPANMADIYYPSGNVGIGIGNPGDLLHVNGSISSTASATGAIPTSIRLDYCGNCGTAGGGASRISAIGADVANRGEFRIDQYSTDATNHYVPFFINRSGNVGIGTTAPRMGFDVIVPVAQGASSFGAQGSTKAVAAGIPPARPNPTVYGWDFSTSNHVPLELRAEPGPQLYLDTNGYIGIGRTAPLANLHIMSNNAPARLAIHNPQEESVFLELAGTGGVGGAEGFEIEYQNNGGDTFLRNRYPIGNVYFQTSTASGAPKTNMTLSYTGNVGIGLITPNYLLDVGGDINASGSVRASGVALSSDVRFKRDIHTLDNVLGKILKLRGVSYEWRSEEFPEKHFTTRPQIGVIAQEVEQEFPELVDTDKNGYKSVNYPALVSPLIESTKELYGMCKANEGQIKEISRKLASVENKASKLEAENALLKARLERIERILQSPSK